MYNNNNRVVRTVRDVRVQDGMMDGGEGGVVGGGSRMGVIVLSLWVYSVVLSLWMYGVGHTGRYL